MVVVKDFSIFILPCEKVISVLKLLYQDEGREGKEYKTLRNALEKYVDVEEFNKKFPTEITNSKDWLIDQLSKKLKKPRKELIVEDVINIWEEIKPLLFRYVANLMVDKEGYFDCYAISAYKKICKILIEEEAFEYLDAYTEGLRVCKGKLKEEFLKRYREKCQN